MTREISKKILVRGAQHASSDSIRKAFDAGHAITIQKGKDIVRRSSDGSEKILSSMDSAFKVVKKKTYSLR